MATTSPATAAATAGRLWTGLPGVSAIPVAVRSAEYGKLNGILFSRAVWAGDFLRFIQDDTLKLGVALVADIFVNGHDWLSPYY
jgi:hypothetical protein